MVSSEENPKLRMASSEPPAQIARRLDREQTNLNRKREVELEQSLVPFRVGTVSYLNSVPLNRGLEDQMIYATPAELAGMMRENKLDAALLSTTEALFHEDYDILDGVAIASLGEVKSVLLAHRGPLEAIQVIHCDPASRASVELLKVLLAERGLQVDFEPLGSYDPASMPDNALLIGNPAIEFLRSQSGYEIMDLGTAWYEMTGLPFVYAVWTLRRGVHNENLRRVLRDAKDFGMDTLDHLINNRREFDLDFRKDYLGWHIHYHLGDDEKKGIAKFIELFKKHQPDRKIYEPVFV